MMRSAAISAFLLMTANSVSNTVNANASSCKTEVATKLNFFDSEVVEKNLHEIGGIMRYENIGVVRGDKVDLVIKSTEGTAYSTTKPWKNGKNAGGKFGNINMMTLEDDAVYNGEGSFDFCFIDSVTDALKVVDSFRWTFYDIDERGGLDNTIKEMLVMDTAQAENFILYPDLENSEVKLVCEDSQKTPTAANPCEPDERTEFKSSTKGTGEDNPTDMSQLNEKQKKRSVVYTFRNKSCFSVTFKHYCPLENGQGCRWYGGGNFQFSGGADQLIQQGECITPPEPPTNPPTVKPTDSPTRDACTINIARGLCVPHPLHIAYSITPGFDLCSILKNAKR